jgi:hypothetical protein
MRNRSTRIRPVPARRPRRGPVITVPVFFATAAWALTACESGDAPDRWQVAIDTVGDTITVRTVAGSVWPEPYHLEEEVRIGVIDGDDAYMLGSIRGMAVSPSGDIYVIDTQVPALRRYGPDGRHISTFGREGGGPGEYRRPDGGIAVLPDGRVLLRDPGNGRIQVYTADGEPIAEWPTPGGGSFNTSRRLYTDTLGNAYTLVLQDRTAPVTEWSYGLARITPSGGHTDTVLVPEFEYERSVIVGQREGSTSVNDVPFTADSYWTFSPLGYVIAGVSDDYSFDQFKPDGVLRVARNWEPVPVNPAEGEDIEQRVAENMRRQFPGWRWNGPPVPDTKPPYRGLFAGDDGRIWVVVSQPGVEMMSEAEAREEEERTDVRPVRFREPVVFDVFEADGRYIGRVETPAGFSLSPQPIMRGDQVWATIRDELDVTYIVQYRIAPITAE